jgi:NAD(P)H-hydrate epimerase
MNVSADDIRDDRVGLVRKAAQETRGVVLLKGPRTLVAAPGGRVYVNPTGGPALATGGTGDVLTGTVAAMLARGLAPQYAAAAGAFVHGTAGDLAAELTGEGTVATDVASLLPDAAATIRAGNDG